MAIAISQDRELTIAVCADTDISRLYVSERTRERTVPLWDVEGSISAEAGTAWTLGEPIEGMSGDLGPPPELAVGNRIYVEIDNLARDGFIDGSFPDMDERFIDGGVWLHTDGSLSSAPCDEDLST